MRLLVRAFPVKLVAWSAASPWGQPLAGYPLARAILSPIAGRFPISKMDREGVASENLRFVRIDGVAHQGSAAR